MSDTNSKDDQLESLQQMLEAEMRGQTGAEPAPPKPAPPEAKPDTLGDLLGDLLSEAEKEVGRDRPATADPAPKPAAVSPVAPSDKTQTFTSDVERDALAHSAMEHLMMPRTKWDHKDRPTQGMHNLVVGDDLASSTSFGAVSGEVDASHTSSSTYTSAPRATVSESLKRGLPASLGGLGAPAAARPRP